MNDQNAKQEPPRLKCPPNCGHTREEHEAFDDGVASGEGYEADEVSNPYAETELRTAWDSGYSVGHINRTRPARTPADAPKVCSKCGVREGKFLNEADNTTLCTKCVAVAARAPTTNASIPLADATGESGEKTHDKHGVPLGGGYLLRYGFGETKHIFYSEESYRKQERRIATLTAERDEALAECVDLEAKALTDVKALRDELAEERNQRQYFEELAIGKAATEAAEGLAKDGFISDAARSAGREQA